MKKFGFVGLGVIGIWLIAVFIAVKKLESSVMMGYYEDLAKMLMPMVTLTIAYHILNNEEHQFSAYILLVVSIISSLVVLLSSKIDTEAMDNIFNIQEKINYIVILITSPFVFKTQSNFHLKYKYGLAIFITILLITVGIIYLSAKNVSTMSGYQSLLKVIEFLLYGGIIALALSLANPIVGYTTGGPGGTMPRLVTVPTIPTIPPELANMTINQGINYGNMPVPDGVVASSPVEAPTPIPTAPVPETLEQAPAPQAPETLEQAPAPQTPAPSINASEVAPELQFIIDNNKQ